jgi:Mn2+/Fe2+ NRAMP family transporter
MVAVRAGVAGLAAISLVAAEALARMRPWFYRASFWLVASICALIITFCVGYGGVVGVGAALMILFLLLAFLVPLLFYLRDEARSMGTLPARRAVPGRIP